MVNEVISVLVVIALISIRIIELERNKGLDFVVG